MPGPSASLGKEGFYRVSDFLHSTKNFALDKISISSSVLRVLATSGDAATCAPVSVDEERRKQNEWPPKKEDMEDAFDFN